MTPQERAAVSRANAQRSTGPRSAAGKATVAGNARRHGLSVPARDGDPAEALALAAAIAGPRTTPQVCAAALYLAHAQIELRRVRRHREPLLEAGEGLPDVVDELAVLDRYETRARARRKAALRAFHRACAEGAGETAKQSRRGNTFSRNRRRCPAEQGG